MLSLFAKRDEPNSGGRQMPGHYGFAQSRVFTSGSPVGTQWPHAAGIGLACKLRARTPRWSPGSAAKAPPRRATGTRR